MEVRRRGVDVHRLAYHRFGVPKYAALGLPYRLDGVPEPTETQVAAARQTFADRGLSVT